MSLTATLQAATKTAFAAAGDLIVSGTYKRRTGTTHNTATGINTPTFAPDITVDVLLSSVKKKHLQLSRVKSTDSVAIIQGSQFTNGEPQTDDELVTGSNTDFVVEVIKVPGNIIYELVVRRK